MNLVFFQRAYTSGAAEWRPGSPMSFAALLFIHILILAFIVLIPTAQRPTDIRAQAITVELFSEVVPEIGPDGSVKAAVVLTSSGEEILDEAALDAVRR